MARGKKKLDDDHYKRAEDLPEDRRKAYNTILDDFSKEVNAHIDQQMAELSAIQSQIRSMFRVAKLKMKKNERLAIFENMTNGPDARLSIQLQAVKSTIETSISSKVFGFEKPCSTVKKSAQKSRRLKSTESTTAGPASAIRQSARKRTQRIPFGSDIKETPSTVKSRKVSARVMQTPANSIPAGCLPIITPKFNMATPLTKTVLRNAKPNEVLVSLSGSPVYTGSTAARSRAKKAKTSSLVDGSHVPVPVGQGKTLMVPTDSPSFEDGSCPIELDDDAKKRLLALRSQIDNMLQLKN